MCGGVLPQLCCRMGGCSLSAAPMRQARFPLPRSCLMDQSHRRRLCPSPVKAAAINLADGRVLVTGGVTAGGDILGSAEIYEAATNSWSTIPAPLIEPRAGHTASLLPDGRVVLAGGETAGRISQSIELFDPSTGAFSFAGTLSMPRAGHAAAVLPDGRVLIAGGSFGGVAPSASTDIFDPATETISAGPELLTGRSGHSATTLLSGNVLIAGGTDGLTDLASAEIFDPATGTIQPANSL